MRAGDVGACCMHTASMRGACMGGAGRSGWCAVQSDETRGNRQRGEGGVGRELWMAGGILNVPF